MSTLAYVTRTGPSIEELFHDLAKLRIDVFKDYPYLYEGSLDYEREYLRTYASCPEALLFAVYDGPVMVGATTCIPLIHETGEVKEPFIKSSINLEEVFYFGESILLKPYRRLGLGHRFFDVRESHAAGFGTYKTTCFCSVSRPDDHPARPVDYRPNDAFWRKRGYEPHPELKSFFEWKDSGSQAPTLKPMTYWTRPLAGGTGDKANRI